MEFAYRYGFNMEGVNRQGENRTLNNGLQFGAEIFDDEGYDAQGIINWFVCPTFCICR